MRKIGLLFYILFTLWSCEDVISVDVPTGESRLIVDAFTRVGVTDSLIPFKIKVTKTNNFFEEIPVTSLERMVLLVELKDEDGFPTTGVATFAETNSGSGIYVPDPCCAINEIPTNILEFDPIFRLIIEHEGKKYYAETKYVPTPIINTISQGNNTLIRDTETEIIISFEDMPNLKNFYLFDFGFNEFLLTDDEFYQNQEFKFSYFYDQIFESGAELDVSILGIDKTLSDYMNQLLEQSESPQGLFQTPVTTVRGNVFDITGLDNRDIFDNVERPNDFALGYFSVVQEQVKTLIIK